METQMEEINRRLNSLENKLENGLNALLDRMNEIEKNNEARYVKKETFMVFQSVLGLIGTAMIIYLANQALPNIFHQ